MARTLTQRVVRDYGATHAHLLPAGVLERWFNFPSDTNRFPTPRSRPCFGPDDLAVGIEAQVEAEVAVHLGLVVGVGLTQDRDEIAESGNEVRDLLAAEAPDASALGGRSCTIAAARSAWVEVIQPATIAGSRAGVERRLRLAVEAGMIKLRGSSVATGTARTERP
jgi:hypothetical protein